MNSNQERLRSLVIGFYAWVIAVFFGGILLDIVYSNRLQDILEPLESTTVFSDVADILLLPGFVTVLAAIGAIAFSWHSRAARNLFIASLLFVLFEFLIPVFFFPFIQYVENLNIGSWLRIIPSGLASILAFIGLYKFYRQE